MIAFLVSTEHDAWCGTRMGRHVLVAVLASLSMSLRPASSSGAPRSLRRALTQPPHRGSSLGRPRTWLALRGGGGGGGGGAGGEPDLLSCSVLTTDETPWGESGARDGVPPWAACGFEEYEGAAGCDDRTGASYWQRASGHGALPVGLPGGVLQVPAVGAPVGRVSFWQGRGLARYSAMYCDVAELMRGPTDSNSSRRDARSLLFWLQMQATEVVKRVSIPPAKERRQQALLANLSAAVADIWGPAAILTPYGSAAAGYGTVESDLDLQLSLGEEWDTKIAKTALRAAQCHKAAAGEARLRIQQLARGSAAASRSVLADCPGGSAHGAVDDAIQGQRAPVAGASGGAERSRGGSIAETGIDGGAEVGESVGKRSGVGEGLGALGEDGDEEGEAEKPEEEGEVEGEERTSQEVPECADRTAAQTVAGDGDARAPDAAAAVSSGAGRRSLGANATGSGTISVVPGGRPAAEGNGAVAGAAAVVGSRRRVERVADGFRTEAINALKTLAWRLRRVEALKVNCIFRARVPIISILGGENDSLDMDISVHALHNFGRYTVVALRVLGEIDPRVRELILAIKTWAQRRQINEAFRGTLNSFSLILMVIFMLQNVEPPILPNIFNTVLPMRGDAASRARKHLATLHGGAGKSNGNSNGNRNGASTARADAPTYRSLKVLPGDAGQETVPVLVLEEADTFAVITGVDGRGKTVRFHHNIEALRGWGTENTQSVSELLVRFFAFYGTEVAWASECISVRHARIIGVPQAMTPVPDDHVEQSISGPSPPAAAPAARRGHAMFIEDCLDDSNNVARCVDDQGLARIHHELVRAWTMLCGNGDLEAVFQRSDLTIPFNHTFPTINVSSPPQANPSSPFPLAAPSSPLALMRNGSLPPSPARAPVTPPPSALASASGVGAAVEGGDDTCMVGKSSEDGGDGETGRNGLEGRETDNSGKRKKEEEEDRQEEEKEEEERTGSGKNGKRRRGAK
jgi:DNA polymerase sigma